jgi:DNA-binding IscR family transcriptional regulator
MPMSKATNNRLQDEHISPTWTFFTNHTHVLVYLALNGDAPLKDVATAIGITERAVQKIIAELELAGVLMKDRIGRRNTYQLKTSLPLRHPLERHCTIGDILSVILKNRKSSKGK